MTPEEFETVARKLTGVTGYLYYHLMGEPLTHPKLPELIAIATKLGFKSQITTNGTLLATRGDALIEARRAFSSNALGVVCVAATASSST